jgi:hypothetical protein
MLRYYACTDQFTSSSFKVIGIDGKFIYTLTPKAKNIYSTSFSFLSLGGSRQADQAILIFQKIKAQASYFNKKNPKNASTPVGREKILKELELSHNQSLNYQTGLYTIYSRETGHEREGLPNHTLGNSSNRLATKDCAYASYRSIITVHLGFGQCAIDGWTARK